MTGQMDKNTVKSILCERLTLAAIPFSRQGNQLFTPHASLQFQADTLILRKTGKAERHLPYHKVRISQLLANLRPMATDLNASPSIQS
jgi:hypothetical protein